MSSANPYSPAFAVGDLGFVSGAFSVDANGDAMPRRTEALTAAMDRAHRAAGPPWGMGLADVVKTTYFVTDISLREEANAHYAQAFAKPRPVRSFVEVAALPYGATVEIESITHRGRRHWPAPDVVRTETAVAISPPHNRREPQ